MTPTLANNIFSDTVTALTKECGELLDLHILGPEINKSTETALDMPNLTLRKCFYKDFMTYDDYLAWALWLAIIDRPVIRGMNHYLKIAYSWCMSILAIGHIVSHWINVPPCPEINILAITGAEIKVMGGGAINFELTTIFNNNKNSHVTTVIFRSPVFGLINDDWKSYNIGIIIDNKPSFCLLSNIKSELCRRLSK